MDISIIISVYKDLESLDTVLHSLEWQTEKNFEIIIAEDCETKEMVEFIQKNTYKFLKLKHVSQEDIGFRKTKILNEAIKIAEGKFVIFLDGDCIVHKDFVKEYKKEFKSNRVLVGRRVLLSERLTKKIKKNFYIPNYFQLLFSKSKHREEGIKIFSISFRKKVRGILGSNFGLSKMLLEKINGFDEDYQRVGTGEDDDLCWRVKRVSNVEIVSIRNKALQYHLDHPRKDRVEDATFNMMLMKKKMKEPGYFCRNGIKKTDF